MRVTNNMITYNFLTSLNSSLGRQNELQEKLSDGKAIHRPSDDPVKAIRSLRFNTNLAVNEQYTKNVNDAISWLETTDGALMDMGSILIRAKELVVSADGSKPPDALNAIGKEIDGLINTLVGIGNTKIGDRYIFAGQHDKTEPFERKMVDPDATPGGSDAFETVIYKGDQNKVSMIIQTGSVDPKKDSIGLTGVDVFGPFTTVNEEASGKLTNTANTLTHLIEIKNELLKEKPDTAWLSNVGLANIDADHTRLLQAHTEIGARMSTYEMSKNLMEANSVTITGDISANEDIDIARTIIDFKTSESVYRAALSVGSRIMPPSLVDFLK